MTHGSLFTGMCGFDLGAEWAGIDTQWTCEINDFLRENLIKKKYPNGTHYKDIKELSYPNTVDIISGGFPCQNISIAASRNRIGIAGNKSSLWREMYRICAEVKPKYIIMENSHALLSKGFDTILREFAEIGYDAEWQTLRGFQFGIPQRRRRLYVIFYSACIGNRMEKRQIFTRWDKPEYPAWRDSEPKIYGMAHVIPYRVDKHRALGNAVQPLIARYLFECIKEFDEKYYNQ